VKSKGKKAGKGKKDGKKKAKKEKKDEEEEEEEEEEEKTTEGKKKKKEDKEDKEDEEDGEGEEDEEDGEGDEEGEDEEEEDSEDEEEEEDSDESKSSKKSKKKSGGFFAKVNAFVKDPEGYMKKTAELKKEELEKAIKKKEKELEKAAKKKLLEIQLKLVTKAVDSVWPKVDPHKTGKIGKDQVCILAKLALEEIGMGKEYKKKEIMKLLKGTEEFTKQDVIKKVNKLVEKLKKEINGGDEEKIDGDNNVESEGKEEEDETKGKKELD